MNSTGDQLDRRVRQLTKELSEAKDNNVPRLLLKIKGIITCKKIVYFILSLTISFYMLESKKLYSKFQVVHNKSPSSRHYRMFLSYEKYNL